VSTRAPSDLEGVAESLADSTTLDWSALERAHPELAGTLARLRVLEQLAMAHRAAEQTATAQGAEAAETAGAGTVAARPAAGKPPRRSTQSAFRWGPLIVHERLGGGAFGEVYRAHDPALGRDVALKLRRAGVDAPAQGAGRATRAWLDEARRLARVSHPNV